MAEPTNFQAEARKRAATAKAEGEKLRKRADADLEALTKARNDKAPEAALVMGEQLWKLSSLEALQQERLADDLEACAKGGRPLL